MVGCSSCMVFMWNNNSLPKTKKMRKTITFKNKSTSTIDTTLLLSSKFDVWVRKTPFCYN